MDELQDIIGDYTGFLDGALESVEAAGFDINDFAQIDHLCYRVATQEDYRLKKTELDSVANLLGEATINGRLIATYRLIEPIYHDIWRIDAIELPAPKPNNRHEPGLEHLEFVIFDDFPTFLQKYDSKPFNLKAAQRTINPEISLKIDDYGIKFHLLALPTVIYIEQALGITEVSDAKS